MAKYLHINNLYKDQFILLFRECWALEKVHGSSAHISWNSGVLGFFAGGQSHEKFMSMFNHEQMKDVFTKLGRDKVMVYGEVYGGKLQGMSETYGNELKFITFDIQIDEQWLSVPEMDKLATELGLEVVPYEKISTDQAAIDAQRDKPSVVAIRRNMGDNKQREGVVLRPLAEMTNQYGERVIAKHKIEKFGERATPQKVVPGASLVILEEANDIANEWVVMHRLEHVVQHLEFDGNIIGMKNMASVISGMIEDVYREAKNEIVESKEVKAAITKKTVELFKLFLQNRQQ